ncbi:MAG TPA: metallophosphoesterase, partial [Labilithrix sp.]
LVASVALLACSSSRADAITGGDQDLTQSKRDWSAHPALLAIDDADEIYALSDPHGHYDMLVQLLVANHLVDVGSDPKSARWTGGSALLVVAGDLIDKGDESLQVIDLLRALQSSGRIIVTLGNHEAEFFADPKNDKASRTGEDADGIDNELDAQRIDPKSIASGADAAGRGRWLADLPFAVRVKKWFFSHAGNSQKLSMKDLEKKLEDSLDHNGWDDKDITGNDSILEAQSWYGDPKDDGCAKKEADALGVDHIVFGHDPGALDDHGSIIASKNGILVKLDTAMGIHDGAGIGKAYLLHVSTVGKDTAEALDASRVATPLF